MLRAGTGLRAGAAPAAGAEGRRPGGPAGAGQHHPGCPAAEPGSGSRPGTARRPPGRERREDRKHGGQPGHPGAGLSRDPGPGERSGLCRRRSARGTGPHPDGADQAGTWWPQARDVQITTLATVYLQPPPACPCRGKINAAQAPPWAYPGRQHRRGAGHARPSGRRWPGATRRWTGNCQPGCATATTRPSPSGSSHRRPLATRADHSFRLFDVPGDRRFAHPVLDYPPPDPSPVITTRLAALARVT